MEYDEYGFPIKYNSGYGLGTGNNTSTRFDLSKLDPLALGQPIKLDMSSLENMNNVGPRIDGKGLKPPVDGKDNSLFGLSTGEWDNALKAGQLGLETGQLVSNVLGYFQQKPIYKEQLNQLKLQSKGLESDINNKLAAREAYKSFGNINNPTTKVVV